MAELFLHTLRSVGATYFTWRTFVLLYGNEDFFQALLQDYICAIKLNEYASFKAEFFRSVHAESRSVGH